MNYNTQKEKLLMPEYGRSVQEMIEYAVSIPDREERQRCAESIFSIMVNMQPQLRELPDYKHRIWDHIAYISGYRLDIDYPCQITPLGESAQKPEPLPYPMKEIQQRQYGYLIEESLRQLAEMPEGEERDALLALTANQMKQSLFTWNRDAMDDEKVAADIAHYTHGKVQLDLSEFHFAPVQTLPRQDGSSKRKRKKI
ncbi:MAG: DUF4290 domain-containing protein [Bacteroidaceae bacterium]|nr:DUF4290 domain-containing protein [Bacteroidaceae bacterium]